MKNQSVRDSNSIINTKFNLKSIKERVINIKTCDICGCSESETHRMINSVKWSMILCWKHYQQLKRHNIIIDPLKQERNRNELNEIIIYNSYAEIILYDMQGNSINKTIIDLDDVEKCKRYKWFIDGEQKYVATHIDNKKIRLHRFIMGIIDNDDVMIDHFDRNKLNNQKHNLRHCTNQENSFNKNILLRNTSGKTGVRWEQKRKKWKSYISVNRKNIFLGYYNDLEEAIKARKEAELKYFKEFAPI